MAYWGLMTYFRIFIIKTETKTEHQIIRGLEILKIVADVKAVSYTHLTLPTKLEV